MNKFLNLVLGSVLILVVVISLLLYNSESEKNKLLRNENLKTSTDAQEEVKKLKDDIQKERDKNLDDKQKLLEQMTKSSKDKDAAIAEMEEYKKKLLEERKFSLTANDDLDKLRREVAEIRKDGKEGIQRLSKEFNNKKQGYETRILSLEEALAKSKKRLSAEAERYHYNLGVVYTQNKDFDSAVKEFKAALGYNPKNARAIYNLGIIFDDYFNDRENAKYYYRTFLQLSPASDDADSVKEWLANLDKK